MIDFERTRETLRWKSPEIERTNQRARAFVKLWRRLTRQQATRELAELGYIDLGGEGGEV